MCANRISTFLRFSARDLEGFSVGERAYQIAHILVDIAGDLACGRRCALGHECADGTIVLARPVRRKLVGAAAGGRCAHGSSVTIGGEESDIWSVVTEVALEDEADCTGNAPFCNVASARRFECRSNDVDGTSPHGVWCLEILSCR